MPSRLQIAVISLALIFAGLSLADAPLTDPTRPDFARDAAPVPGANFKVTAIFFSDERQHAVVNGKLVSKGDQIDGARVMQIRPDALDLLYRGEAITRRLPTVKLRK